MENKSRFGRRSDNIPEMWVPRDPSKPRELVVPTDNLWLGDLEDVELRTLMQYNKWVNENRGGKK